MSDTLKFKTYSGGCTVLRSTPAGRINQPSTDRRRMSDADAKASLDNHHFWQNRKHEREEFE